MTEQEILRLKAFGREVAIEMGGIEWWDFLKNYEGETNGKDQ